MKHFLLISAFCVLLVSCAHRGSVYKQSSISPTDSIAFYVVDIHDTNDGRPLFNVVFPDGKVLERMYAEEIAGSLLQGKWSYNEDLKLSK